MRFLLGPLHDLLLVGRHVDVDDPLDLGVRNALVVDDGGNLDGLLLGHRHKLLADLLASQLDNQLLREDLGSGPDLLLGVRHVTVGSLLDLGVALAVVVDDGGNNSLLLGHAGGRLRYLLIAALVVAVAVAAALVVATRVVAARAVGRRHQETLGAASPLTGDGEQRFKRVQKAAIGVRSGDMPNVCSCRIQTTQLPLELVVDQPRFAQVPRRR
mmetsp:Transcript_14460/g.43108  ORF Transcript_14460/g.43108 Transcript_14460/m.43108 type:complete len:214 (+) Transcript_14460:540-1181(+)